MSVKSAGLRLVNNHFHALTHRNYRYFWFGQCVSVIGTWMQSIGQSWLVLTLTGSPLLLGLVGTIQFLPVTFLSLFAGVLIDKFPKKQILLVTQSVSMLLAFVLAALVFTDTVQYGHVLALAFLLGLSNTFDMPTRQAFNIEIVGKEDLLNAIALNSMTFNLARIIGPSIGAVMMAWVGPGWCFLLNGLSFVAVIYGLTRIQASPYVRKKKAGTSLLKEIGEGLAYIARDRVLSQALLFMLVVGTLAYNFNVFIPVLTREVLHLEEQTYGLLMSCLGAGSLIGALAMSLRSRQGPKRQIILLCAVLVSCGMVVTGLIHSVVGVAISLAATGICTILFSMNVNSTLQIQSKDEYRARVMSVYSLVFTGSTPLGNFFAGLASEHFGADGALIGSGVLCLVLFAVVVVAYRRKPKPEPEMAPNGAAPDEPQQSGSELAGR